jgi:hypothetical protein
MLPMVSMTDIVHYIVTIWCNKGPLCTAAQGPITHSASLCGRHQLQSFVTSYEATQCGEGVCRHFGGHSNWG